jgi:peptidyl-prolyl cis-trans isomerase SurA
MQPGKPALGLISALVLALLVPARAADDLQRDARATPAPASTTSPEAAQSAGKNAAKPAKSNREENGIVALVNDLPITSYELRQRMNLVYATSGGLPHTPEVEKKIRDQVLEQLETELLQRQEAQKNDITVSSVEVDKYVQNILDENHMALDQLKQVLARGGVQIATFRAQLAAQLLWQKAVQEHYAGRVNIAPEAIDAEMSRIKEGASKVHFEVSEIFLAVDNPDQDDAIRKKSEDLASQIKAGAQFPAIARQFSQSPSAAQGGDMGMVYDGQLAPELNNALLNMKTGDMSAPIRSIGGYYILVLRQRLEPVGTKIVEVTPSAETLPASLPLGRILLQMPPKPPKDYVEKVMGLAKQIQGAITSCDMAEKTIAKNVPGALYFGLGTVRLADLNQETRDALAKTESGGVAEPFLSAAGAEIFVRCDKREIKQVVMPMPTRDQIEQQLFSEQISALARRYNRDLRRSANIEVR